MALSTLSKNLKVQNTNKILIVCSDLNVHRGQERIIAQTANLLSEEGKDVSLLFIAKNMVSAFPLLPAINQILLNINFGITESGNMITRKFAFLKHLYLFRKEVLKVSPTIIILTEYHFAIAGVLSLPASIKKISWEFSHFPARKKNKFWSFLLKKTYPRLNEIVCLNNDESLHEIQKKNYYNSWFC
jgi:hypothetical protein